MPTDSAVLSPRLEVLHRAVDRGPIAAALGVD